jgi:transposase
MGKSIQKYDIILNQDQKDFLVNLTSKGKESARKIKRANILLRANEGKKDKEIAEIVKTSRSTIERIRKRFVKEGLESALEEKPRPGEPKKIDGRAEAEIITLACSNPPEGRAKWTLRLLADKVEFSVSHVSVYNTLKKMKLNLG